MEFLPATTEEMHKLGWEQPDFVLVSGDPYVDHPSFGIAVIARVLERGGYKTALLAQPDWHSANDFRRFGRPRLGFLISAGSVDSMVANYTAGLRRRRTDSLAPGGRSGQRPDRAGIVYTNRCREVYKDVAVILGGIEASLRRLAHYDYWDDALRRSVLLDAKADLLVYGMGERAIIEIAHALNEGFAAREITWVNGTVYRAQAGSLPEDVIMLPSWEELNGVSEHGDDRLRESHSYSWEERSEDRDLLVGTESTGNAKNAEYAREKYNESFLLKYDNNEAPRAKPLAERYDDGLFIVQNPPQPPLTTAELDALYELPFVYDQHPMYAGRDIPALHEIRFSIAHVRGCYGNCAFCAITNHQGRTPTVRSRESVVREAERMTHMRDFKGYIHDVGGPTANISGPACEEMARRGPCARRDCLFPAPCPRLRADHRDYIDLLTAVRKIPGVKKVFVRSGIRHDLVLADRKNGKAFVDALARFHVSGLLKIAPEHTVPAVLNVMRKPPAESYEAFAALFHAADAQVQGKNETRAGNTRTTHGIGSDARAQGKQFLLPYFISAHPGCSLADADALAGYMKRVGFIPDQIQDFYPTPATLATCIYYTGIDPFTGETVYVPGRNPQIPDERRLQRALLHSGKPENRQAYLRARSLLGKGTT